LQRAAWVKFPILQSRLPQIWSIWLPRIPQHGVLFSPHFWYPRLEPQEIKKYKSILSKLLKDLAINRHGWIYWRDAAWSNYIHNIIVTKNPNAQNILSAHFGFKIFLFWPRIYRGK
jgi:hypothetical protein